MPPLTQLISTHTYPLKRNLKLITNLLTLHHTLLLLLQQITPSIRTIHMFLEMYHQLINLQPQSPLSQHNLFLKPKTKILMLKTIPYQLIIFLDMEYPPLQLRLSMLLKAIHFNNLTEPLTNRRIS